MSTVIFDLETTGLDPWLDEIITGHFIADDKNRNTIDTLSVKMKPRQWRDEYALAEQIHGFSYQELATFPESEAGYEAIINFLNKHSGEGSVLVCHANARSQAFDKARDPFFKNPLGSYHFDLAMLRCYHRDIDCFREFERTLVNGYTIEGTHSIARSLNLPGKLNKLAEHFGIPINHHDAKSDTEATREIYYELKNLTERVFEFGMA